MPSKKRETGPTLPRGSQTPSYNTIVLSPYPHTQCQVPRFRKRLGLRYRLTLDIRIDSHQEFVEAGKRFQPAFGSAKRNPRLQVLLQYMVNV